MDRIASITAFVRVAESSGFTAAARRLGLSTTTVSNQVQALENALGVRLLNRTTRQVIVTEIGANITSGVRGFCTSWTRRTKLPAFCR
jgi:DNA-binding transcriptional LysR family regulator